VRKIEEFSIFSDTPIRKIENPIRKKQILSEKKKFLSEKNQISEKMRGGGNFRKKRRGKGEKGEKGGRSFAN